MNQSEIPNLFIFEDPEHVARAAADRFVQLAAAAIEKLGRFSVALSGGSTPERIYQLLSSDEDKNRIKWNLVHVFFGDERCVPHDHKESNYRMANEALLSHVPISSVNIHRMEGQGDAVANARLYESELRDFFGDTDWPRLDLIMLGMGDDGHTASLFPGSTALDERKAWVVANWVKKFNTYRISLSAPAINHAVHVMFVVSGTAKSERLAEVLSGPHDGKRLPSQLIKPVDGSLEWLLDRGAAEKLS